MRALVAHPSKHGATALIAERIGETLTRVGHEVTARNWEDIDDWAAHIATELQQP